MASNRQFKHPIIPNDTRDDENIIDDTVRMIKWNGTELNIKHLLTMDDAHEMIGNVLRMYSNIYMGIGSPDMALFGTRLYTVLYYSDIELPDDIDERYRIIYGTDLYDTVCKYISQKQIDDIRMAIQIIINGDK